MTAQRLVLPAIRSIVLVCLALAAATILPAPAQAQSEAAYDTTLYHGMRWRNVTFPQIERYPDAVFWLSPEAFRYYLPGFLVAGLRESRWDSNAYDSLIGMLNRSADPNLWDNFFLPRWPPLTVAEVEAVAAWAEWLQAVQPHGFRGNTYERVQTTLALLRQRRAAGEK